MSGCFFLMYLNATTKVYGTSFQPMKGGMKTDLWWPRRAIGKLAPVQIFTLTYTAWVVVVVEV